MAGSDGTRSAPLLPQLRLDELLAELQTRLAAVVQTRDRIHALLEAVVAVGANLDLPSVLHQIVEAAVTLVDARYGALGVIGDGGKLTEFVTIGLADEQIRAIAHWPSGKGLLGELITRPEPLQLHDMSAHPRSSGFPSGHPPMRTFLGVPVRVRDEVFGNLYLTEKHNGADFDDEDQAVVTALAAAAGVTIENARLYEDARRQQRWLRASADTIQRLLSGAEVSEVLALVTREALEISGADLVVLAMPAPGGRQLVIEHAAGAGADQATGHVLPAAGSVSGLVLRSGNPLRLDDLRRDERVAQSAREHLNLETAVVVPLGAPGNVRGILTAGRCPGSPPLPPWASELLITYAAQAGIGLELAEHRQDAERFAVYDDRDRIARDLHDLVIQRLYATGMSLEGVTARLGDSETGRRVSSAVDALDKTIKEIRAAIFSLQDRPGPGEEQAGLRARILAVTDEAATVLGFAPGLRLGGRLEDVPADTGDHLLGTLREALSNAARHSGASRVDVTVEAGQDLALTVRDNGSGIKDTSRRSGLANLADRARALGGELRVGPADGVGTELRSGLAGAAGAGVGTELYWRIPLTA